MEANTMRCRECKGEMKLGALEPLSGKEQEVSVKIEHMPAMQCAQGHKRFVAPDFAVKMMNALLAGTIGRMNGLLVDITQSGFCLAARRCGAPRYMPVFARRAAGQRPLLD